MLKNRKGFTLIELLIVVVIIGILAAIAIPKFSATREKAYFSAMKSDLRNLQTAQEIYYSSAASGYQYASTVADLDFKESDGVNITIKNVTSTGYSATATHDALDSATQTCTVYVGSAAEDANKTPGAIECIGEN